jgi:very-short-patch-repair endonuclease
MTDAETRLWWKLRNRQLDGAYFRRQQPIGRYIVDFVCFERGLVVELDGGQHALAAARDEVRDAWLATQGLRVLRFWNPDVMRSLGGVLETILNALRDTPPPTPSHKGRG